MQGRDELREKLERLDLVLKAAQIGVWHLDLVNNKREFDDQAFRLLGLDKESFTGTPEEYFGVVHPEDRAKIRSALARAIENDEPYLSEYRVILPDGSIRYITGRGKVVRDPTGRAVRMHGIHWDITDDKRAERALAKSEERFKRLVQNSNDIICLLDGNGSFASVSGPLERITGYRPEDVQGTNAFDLIHPDDVENVKEVFGEAVRQPGRSRVVEYRYRIKDGNWISVEAVGTNLLDDPVVQAVVVAVRDISERKKLQEQLQQAMKMEAIGRLAGGVAHDFNNILTVISGNVGLARRQLSSSDPLADCLDQVMKASDSAAALTRQLLAFSRKQIIEPRVLNLNDLVDNMQQMLVRVIGENVTLRTVLCDDLGSVKVDPGQFEQVLVNLAVNARDAMVNGGCLTIETANQLLDERYCATHPEAQPGDFVVLAVSDTGQGMSEEVQEHLFEPFFTTKEKGQGTGLGLATIFGAVKQAGGSIDVFSEPGRGTAFRIFLPLVEMKAEKLTRERQSLDLPTGNETILLVEDEESVRKVAIAILKELGYRPIEARNGDEALMHVERSGTKIDLLMTDIVMPGMNGKQLSERVRRLHPAMKVLFTSGYAEDSIVHHGVVEADLNFIGKPYSIRALASKIRGILGPRKE
jgi:PAS domain S-box-containing protein